MYPKKPKPEQQPAKPKQKQLTVSVLGRHMKIACPAGQEEKLQNAMLELEERVGKNPLSTRCAWRRRRVTDDCVKFVQ